MKNIIKLAFVVVIFFAGCKNTDESKTVEYYLQNDKERQETAKECNNNYGELGNTPNCINAYEAAWKKISGKSDINKNNNKSLLEGAR
ncbi:MAG: EexN family lipoprotein [Sulfurovaceae bacterium]